MATIPETLNLALQHHQAGRLPEAEALYRQILQAQPDHPDALHLLGVIAHQTGRHDLAVRHIEQAIAHHPQDARYHNNLGEAYRAQGKPDEAAACYRQALTLTPTFPEPYNNLGTVLHEQGQAEKAMVYYRQALTLNPAYAEAHNNLGNVLKEQGQLKEAMTHYRQALALKPAYAEAYNNLGTALKDLGRVDEAAGCYRQALVLKPAYAEAYNNLGNALIVQGKLGEAIASYRQALALKPAYAEAYNNLGSALKDQGRLDEAIGCYRQALTLKRDFAVAHSNLLFSLHYHPASDPATIFTHHREWNDQHAKALVVKTAPPAGRRDLKRALRIGYVSADFRRHPVGYFFEPALSAHDKSQFRVYCYSGVVMRDEVTARIQAAADEWREIAGVSDEDAARMIRDDGIDILVDLSGHTAGNRLLVFARKPAPIQATWMGYVNTTGLDTMDYLITDGFASPAGGEQLFTEQLIRLPDNYLCYRPPEYAPVVAPCPQRSNGYPTFGCFNNLSKVSADMVALWSKILRRVTNARLVLKNSSLNDSSTREHYRTLFLEHGIAPERVDLPGSSPHAELLAYYGQVDIALDTFPYTGGLTTLEALWMGVPVITLAGTQFVSRTGVSLLSNAGLPELIAASPERYVELAAELSLDVDRLSRLRAAMRTRMAASPLCDAATFARNLEQAYRKMWRNQHDKH